MENNKMVTLSFDDGTVQDRRFIKMIEKYGLKCTFNLNSGLFGNKHSIEHDGINVCHDELPANEIRALYRNHELAVHTLTHPNLLNCSLDTVKSEITADYENLCRLTDTPVIGMAYPCGPYYNEEIIQVITQNTPIRYARTTLEHHTFQPPKRYMEWHPTCHQNDPELMNLAHAFLSLKTDVPALFYIWGHSFEFDKYQSWDKWEEFCALIANRPDMDYVTNGDAYRRLTRS